MAHYMAELILTDRPILVVGGGAVAKRKLRGLLSSGARLTVAAPELDPWILERVEAGEFRHLANSFQPEMLKESPRWALVFAATGDAAVNREIANSAKAMELLCNSADGVEVSGFLVPAMVRRGPVAVGVATEGNSPALSRLLKERIDAWLEPGWGPLVSIFGTLRRQVNERLKNPVGRRVFWREIALNVKSEKRYLRADNEAWFLERLKRAASEERHG